MSDTLKKALSALFEAGGGEMAAERRVLVLFTLDSEMRVAIDAEARFHALAEDRPPTRFEPGTELVFCEVLETSRNRFEDRLCDAARVHSLPESDLLAAFPVLELVRSVLEKNMAHTTRLALLWVLPSELRELRADIIKASRHKDLPPAVKQLCERLIVPE